MVTKINTATVRIQRVEERRTRASWQRPLGLRRFLIQAEKTTGESSGERTLSFATLDMWKASLCAQAREQGRLLKVRYRTTRFFDYELVSVELVKESQVSA